MISILDLDEKRIYVENEKWSCYFGFGRPVKLALVLEAVDLAAESDRCNEDLDWEKPIFESHWDEDSNQRYSIVIDAYIIPQPQYLDEEIVDQARDEGASSRIDLISYVYENYGGVPVNIDALQPAKSSCGFSSFVAETNISSVEDPSGDEIEMRHFQDRSEAMKFAKDFYAVYAGQLLSFIDLLLDNPLLAGGTGWDKIRDLTKPGSTHSKKIV
jgi:hypothetical protein